MKIFRRTPLLMVGAVTAVLLIAFVGSAPHHATADSGFATPAFLATWQRTDQPVAGGGAGRSWYWGPSLGNGLQEPYAESAGGQRLVQYFDKSRMEINNSATNTVTNGLLSVEMITGKLQKGDNTFEQHAPATIPVAGDTTNPFPTYADLGSLYNKPQPDRGVGTPAAQRFVFGVGVVHEPKYAYDPLTHIAVTQNSLGIPAAFWNFLNASGPVYVNGKITTDKITNWLFSTGLPITEAYWTTVNVGGQPKDVLFQAFERRVLTYTPTNNDPYKVEMGNVGQHYVKWRYNGILPKPQPANPLLAVFANATGVWYTADGTANVRTGPGTSFGSYPSTTNLPYIQQVYAGDHVQAFATVSGENVNGSSDQWLQIYQNPDLFVYAPLFHQTQLDPYPTPPRTHPGIWVSVSKDGQDMAVFNGNQLIYHTLISTGHARNNAEDEDHFTPDGVFSIQSYRVPSQTMVGGNKATGTGYSLDDIRNVNYFFEDYAIHGTYWHAKFGIQPMSHGCVNATTYDAGLIYQLPVGTIVDVFGDLY